MSGISPSLLHSIKLEQSATVKELLGGGWGEGQAKGCLASSVLEAMSGISFKKRLS